MAVSAGSPRNAAGWRESAGSALLALGGAALWSLCFSRVPSLWLPWVALVPLVLLLGRRRAVFWGAVYGVALWLGSMSWIAATLESFGGLSPALSLVTQGLLALYLGFDQVVFVVLARGIWRRAAISPSASPVLSVLPALLGLPALWVTLEWLRGVAFGRFPWNLAAYAWVDVSGALPLASWVGAFGVSLLLMFVNVCVALAWRRRRWEWAVSGILVALTVLILAGRFAEGEAQPGTAAGGHEVRVIQPDAAIVSTWEASWENYDRLIAMSEAECVEPLPAAERRLLIWPESAAWPHSYGTSARLRQDVARLTGRGCDVLLGSQIDEGQKAFNSALLVTAAGPVGSYSKRKLVPWGEYVPLAEVIPFLGKVARNAGDFSPGTELGLLPWAGESFAPAICYEVIFPEAVAEQVRAGASLLVTITNDGWYGDTWAPHQHFRAARFRAAENRRPLVRAALTGISGLIDRRGQVTAQLGVGEQGVLRARLTGSRELSPYSRAPWLVPASSALLAALAVVSGWFLTGKISSPPRRRHVFSARCRT